MADYGFGRTTVRGRCGITPDAPIRRTWSPEWVAGGGMTGWAVTTQSLWIVIAIIAAIVLIALAVGWVLWSRRRISLREADQLTPGTTDTAPPDAAAATAPIRRSTSPPVR